MANLNEILATRIRQMRAERKLSQEVLAERIGVSTRHLGAIERQETSPTVTVLSQIAAAFDVPASELLSRKQKRSKRP